MKIDYYSDELQSLLLQVIAFYENRDVKLKAVLSKSRTRPLPEVRAVYSVLAIEKFNPRFSIPQILGQINCDHSNYLHYKKMISEFYPYDRNFRNFFNKIKSEIMPDMQEVNYLSMEDIHND
jgi:chromosomal replication initiation ATPase DnaA